MIMVLCVWRSCVLTLLVLASLEALKPAEGSTGNETGGDGPLTTGESSERDDPCEKEERSLDSEVNVASLNFDELQTVLVVTIFVMVVVVAKLAWHHNLMHLASNNIPESCMLIVIGTFIGGIILGSFYIDKCNRDKDPPFRFTPELFFLYLLPPIVLESGYFLDNRAFFENIVTICVYALVGTIWNAFALGFTLYGLYQAGAILVGLNVKFTISSALLFGTICSAVDPVAVLAVFEEIHVNKLLHVLVFGESLLNDAVTIVLFNLLGAFANRPFDPVIGENERDITVGDVFIGIAQFFVVVIASVIIGILVGMAAAFITRFSEHVHVLEPIIVFTMGYLSYILADLFELSGIVSLIFCAIVMKHYVEANISRKSHTTIKYSLKVLSNVSEMIIFLFLGLSLYDATVHNWDWGLSMFTVFFALLFRPIGVIVLTLILNVFRVRKIGVKSIFVMSYSGLRGAVAFALALSRIFEEEALQNPDDPDLENELTLRRTMLTSVTFLLLFTVFIQGTTIKPLARRIGVKTLQEQKPTMNAAILGTSIDHVMSGIEDILGHFGHNRIREWMQRIDTKYLRWIFERYPEARDEEIYHTFKRLQYKESNEAAEKNLVFEYRKDDMGSHISLHEEAECEQVMGTNEDCIPALNDVLNSSFIPPHENHLRHMLPRDEREHNQDHRFEPVNTQRNLLEYKRGRRRAKHRQARHFGRQGTQESIHVSSPRLAEIEEDRMVDLEISLEDFGHASSHEALTPKQTPILLESMETDV